MKLVFRKIVVTLTLSLFVFPACNSGGETATPFAGTRGSASKDKISQWLSARDYCAPGGEVDPSKFEGGTPSLPEGQGLCVAAPEDNFKTALGTLEVSGMVHPFDRELVGIDVRIEKDGSACSGPNDAENGCAFVNIDTFGDIDEDGAFATSVALPQPGIYTVRIHASFFFFTTGESREVSVQKTVFREAAPQISLAGIAFDDNNPPNEVYICEGRFENEYKLSLTPCDAEESPDEVLHAKHLDICVLIDDQTCSAGAGTCEVGATATAEVVNAPGTSGNQFRQKISSDIACEEALGGRSVRVPIGHNLNTIEFTARNAATIADPSSSPFLRLREFTNDSKGPALCVTYLDQSGNVLGIMDGKPIETGSVTDIIVDVALEECPREPSNHFNMAQRDCLTKTEFDMTDNRASECLEDNPATEEIESANLICIQKGNKQTGIDEENPIAKALFTELCPAGEGHFQAQIGRHNLDFPINTFTIKAFDEWGNKTEKTESFGLGKVHGLFDAGGQLKFDQLSEVLSLFISDTFIEGEGEGDLKNALEQIANTDEFKYEVFLKAFDPVQPVTSELSCIGNPENIYDDTELEEIKTFKLHPFDNSSEHPDIGRISIPYIFILNQNRIQMGLKISRLKARADMFTMSFVDTDGDGVADLGGDIDDDNDGLCDDKDVTEGDGAENGRCRPAKNDSGEEIDDPYDNRRAMPYDSYLRGGEIVAGDRCLGVDPLPLKLQIKDLWLQLELKLEERDGRYKISVQAIDKVEYPLVKFKSTTGNNNESVVFDCERAKMLTPDENGDYQDTNYEQCDALRTLEASANGLGLEESCLNSKVWVQLKRTVENMLTCNIPNRIVQDLDQYQSNKLQQLSFKVLGKKVYLDLFSDILGGELRTIPPGDPVSTWGGIGASAPGLILPAGIVDEGEEISADARSFMQRIAIRLRGLGVSLDKFGPLYQGLTSRSRVTSPINALRNLGREMSLGVSEEALNLALHTVNTLLFDVDKKDPTFLDINAQKVRKDFDQPVFGHTTEEGSNPEKFCYNADGDIVDEDECFPIPLNVQEFFGNDIFKDIDFDQDGEADSELDRVTPLSIHLSVNPEMAITTKLGRISSTNSSVIVGEFEVGISNATLSFFEEDESGKKLSWCHQQANRGDLPSCQRGSREGDELPIARYFLSGKLTYQVLFHANEDRNGEYELSMGLANVLGASSPTADVERSFLKFSLIENNTIYKDSALQAIVNNQIIKNVVPSLAFGAAQTVTIKMPKHIVKKLQEVANEDRDDAIADGEEIPESVFDTEDWIRDLNKFEIQDVEIQNPTFSIYQSVPRHLDIGFDLELCYLTGSDLCDL